MKQFRTWALIACFVAGSGAAFATDGADPAQRLRHAAEMTSLDDPTLKPWHLKLDVQLYDDNGQSSEKGTFEEWWTPERDKRVYAMPSYAAAEIRDGSALFRTKGAENVPYVLNEVRENIVHPVKQVEPTRFEKAVKKEVAFGAANLDCLYFDNRGTPIPSSAGSTDTFCLNKDNDELRASWNQSQITLVNSHASFQGKMIAVDSTASRSNLKLVSTHVAALTGFTPDDSTFARDAGYEDRTDGPMWLSPYVAGKLSEKSVPFKVPTEAINHHITGSVLMDVTIGKDGQVQHVTVVGHPNPILAAPAVDALKRSTYRPYVVNGVAIQYQVRQVWTFDIGPK